MPCSYMRPAVPPPHLPNDAGALLFVLAFFSIALPKPNFSSPLMKNTGLPSTRNCIWALSLYASRLKRPLWKGKAVP